MKILIADDDVLIRKWLGLLIQQDSKNDLELYQVENGEEALSVIRETAVDLLITDIKMPIVDGVELIHKAKELNPKIRIVVLSAYDDYNYVRTTLKSGVLDYLLKAEMDLEDIHAILHTVEQDMFLESTMEQNNKERMLEDCLPHAELFRNFWEDESIDPSEFLRQTGVGLRSEHLFLSMVCIDGKGKIMLSHSRIIVVISNILKGKNIRNVVLPYYNDCFIILYNSQEIVFEKQKEENGLLMTYIDVALKRYVECKIQFSINVRLNCAEELRGKIIEEEQMMLKKQYYRDQNVKVVHNKEKEEAFAKKYRDQIKYALDGRQPLQAGELLERFIKKSHEDYLSPEIIMTGCTGILYDFLNYTKDISSKERGTGTEDFMVHLMKIQNADELEIYMKEKKEQLFEITRSSPRKYSKAIEKSILYIEEYCTEKISLEQVAGEVFLNKNYFSELFKKEVGMNYNDYLNEARIQKACGYIASGEYSFSEVAQMAGFSDQNYFAKIFKKVVGETPMMYKRKLGI